MKRIDALAGDRRNIVKGGDKLVAMAQRHLLADGQRGRPSLKSQVAIPTSSSLDVSHAAAACLFTHGHMQTCILCTTTLTSDLQRLTRIYSTRMHFVFARQRAKKSWWANTVSAPSQQRTLYCYSVGCSHCDHFVYTSTMQMAVQMIVPD